MCKNFLIIFLVVGVLGGCCNKIIIKPERIIEKEVVKGNYEWNLEKQLLIVNFDYDKFNIRNVDNLKLFTNALNLNLHNNGYDILIEGHCDERGTIEYNLALGQRRAEAVKQYYIYLGIDIERIKTISYGKEKPLVLDSNENAWAKNRRVETKVKEK